MAGRHDFDLDPRSRQGRSREFDALAGFAAPRYWIEEDQRAAIRRIGLTCSLDVLRGARPLTRHSCTFWLAFERQWLGLCPTSRLKAR